ncbi:11662_t:CDS:2, partial [Ambispora leptoticha]
MLDWIRDNLKDLKPKDFYQAFNFSHTSRRFAEEKLRELLMIIKDGRNSSNRNRAICLLDSFEIKEDKSEQQTPENKDCNDEINDFFDNSSGTEK